MNASKQGLTEIGLKECSLCKIYLPISKFRVRKNFYKSGKDYIVARCRSCEVEMTGIQHDKSKKREAERKRFAIPENKIRKNKYQRNWRSKNIQKNRAYHQKNIKKNVDELTDLYVSRNLVHVKKGIKIPSELIEAERAKLKLKRLIKKIENGKK